MEHFKAVEAALYEAAGFQEECSRAQVVAALLSVDPELTDKQARPSVVKRSGSQSSNQRY